MRSPALAAASLALCLAGVVAAQVAPPDLGTLVTVPVTSATTCARVAVDVPARGPAVVTGVTAGAWSGLSLPTGKEGFLAAGDPPPPDELRVRLVHGFTGVAVALDGREIATLTSELAPGAAALRGALAAARVAARRADDDRLAEVTLEADADVPFAHVALVTALVAEGGHFCGFASGAMDPPADVRRTLASSLRGRAPGEAAFAIRADGAAPWRAVSELLDAAAQLGVARYTFVVVLGGAEQPLTSAARAGPARIYFDAEER